MFYSINFKRSRKFFLYEIKNRIGWIERKKERERELKKAIALNPLAIKYFIDLWKLFEVFKSLNLRIFFLYLKFKTWLLVKVRYTNRKLDPFVAWFKYFEYNNVTNAIEITLRQIFVCNYTWIQLYQMAKGEEKITKWKKTFSVT